MIHRRWQLFLGSFLLLAFSAALLRPLTAETPPKEATSKLAPAETVRIATYNIENFEKHFDQHDLPYKKKDKTEFFRDTEDLYEVARVMNLPQLDADIIVLQECCTEKHLKSFNTHWLRQKYSLVKVLPSNTSRVQHLAVMAKKGFTPIEIRSYANDRDPVDDPKLRGLKKSAGLEEGNKLFSRGPSFVLFETPGGNRIWVGTTHTKSKYRNSEAVTKLRIRETQRTREICGELIKEGKTPWLYIGGDFNDTFEKDDHEKKIGQDAISQMLAGKGAEKLVSLTKPLVDKDPKLATYHGEIKPARLRSFLDHVFVSPKLAPLAKSVTVVDDPIAAVASDHYPVVIEFALPAVRAKTKKALDASQAGP